MRNMGISKAVVFTNCVPIFTAFFAFLLVGDKLTLQNLLGIVIVVAGLSLSQVNGRKKTRVEAAVLTG